MKYKKKLNDVSTGDIVSICGTWYLENFVHEVLESHEKKDIMGKHPNGLITFTKEGRVHVIIAAEIRPLLSSEAVVPDSEKVALYDSFMAYSGTYTIEDNNYCTFNIDISWNRSWEGTSLKRIFHLSRNNLEIDLLPQIGIDGNLVTAKLTWLKEKK